MGQGSKLKAERIEAEKIRGCGPSAFGGLREALSAALGWRQEGKRIRRSEGEEKGKTEDRDRKSGVRGSEAMEFGIGNAECGKLKKMSEGRGQKQGNN